MDAERQRALDALTERAAAEAAKRNALNSQIGSISQRLTRLAARDAEISAERAKLEAEAQDIEAAAAADAAVEAEQRRTSEARARLDDAEALRAAAQDAESKAREVLQEAQSLAGRLGAEEKGLTKLLAIDESSLWPPLIDTVSVATGYEAALGAALGDDLKAAADSAAPTHWQILPPYDDAPALPAGAEPLANFVQAPAALARRLAQIGVVADADGPGLSLTLRQGQRLVSRSGALWRWDGYTVRAGAPSAAATRLEQRNRLADLREQLREAELKLADARREFDAAHGSLQQAQAGEVAARTAARQAEVQLDQARSAQTKAMQIAAARATRLAALTTSAEQIAADSADAQAQAGIAEAELQALPPETEARELIDASRQVLEGLRAKLAEARAELEQLRRDAAERARRLSSIATETRTWTERQTGAVQQIAQLADRRQEVERELAAIRDLPAALAEKRAALLDQIAMAEAERNRAADALLAAEQHLADCDRAAKTLQEELGHARELRVRAEAEAEHAEEQRAELEARIRETLECAPELVLAAGDIAEDEALPELAQVEMRLERLKKERDGMGPVNLRAEIEAQEVEEQLTSLQNERADLEAAIARLRQGISSLNREGRERLLAAFKQVDAHFQELFVKVFGGGRAHLALTESDDPLEAGLEIMASPPGKKLQVMSLLSGGEQALTALSLLFAVFMTNPAPICVLDEVDAPLDDANVERLCDLLDGMAQGGDTRFLVVTHHPITMARMDRLYGVTMGERGVSQLVSVDLATAEALRQTA